MHPRPAGDGLGARVWETSAAGGIGASRLLMYDEDAAIKPRAALGDSLALG